MRRYILILVCFIIGCQDNSRYIDPIIDKPKPEAASVTTAQVQRAADNANAMRLLASEIEAGRITTMTEANSFTRAKALDSQAAFNKVFASEIGRRLAWSEDGTDDKLPANAAEVFRSFADEFDKAAGELSKPVKSETNTDVKPRTRRNRAVRVR